MANQRIRGQEATIRIATSNPDLGISLLEGSFFKTKDFNWGPMGEITEDDFIGETSSDFDYREDGHSGTFTIDKNDSSANDFAFQMSERNRLHLKPIEVTINVTFKFRDLGTGRSRIIFGQGIMMMQTQTISGRKEFITNAFEWKAKRRVR